MKKYFDYDEARMKVIDFTLSVERFANAASVLNTYYQLSSQDYPEFWRLNSLINAVMCEQQDVMIQREDVRQIFSD